METYSKIMYYADEEGFIIKHYKDVVPFCWIYIEQNHPEYSKYLAWVAEGNTAEEWTGN